MNISEQEYLAVVDDIMEAMDNNNHGDDEKKMFWQFSIPLRKVSFAYS